MSASIKISLSLPTLKLRLQDGGNIIQYSSDTKNYYHNIQESDTFGWYIAYSVIDYNYNNGKIHKLENNETTNEDYCSTLFNLSRNNHLMDYNCETNNGII